MTNTATSQHSARPRFGFQYWTIILVLNLIAALKRPLDEVLFVDGLIVALFGVAALAIWLKKIWFRRDSH